MKIPAATHPLLLVPLVVSLVVALTALTGPLAAAPLPVTTPT